MLEFAFVMLAVCVGMLVYSFCYVCVKYAAPYIEKEDPLREIGRATGQVPTGAIDYQWCYYTPRAISPRPPPVNDGNRNESPSPPSQYIEISRTPTISQRNIAENVSSDPPPQYNETFFTPNDGVEAPPTYEEAEYMMNEYMKYI